MEKLIDLHTHSTFSDGTKTPTELVKLAKEAGLFAFALTDHDSINGLEEAKKAAKEYNIKLIPGVELSTGYMQLEQDVHILGYNIDYKSNKFQKHLEDFQNERINRNKEMIKRLCEDGYDISYEQLIASCPDAVITRAHFARFLMDKGYVSSVKEGIFNFLSKDSKYYVTRKLITPQKAVEIIKEAGGRAVLAHPLLYGLNDSQLRQLITLLKYAGLDGIEAIYSLNSEEDDKYVKKLACEYDLKITGGSDYHGSNKPDISIGKGLGNLKIPYSLITELLADTGKFPT